MDKKLKKYIVNGLTLSRVIGTILLPLLFFSLPAASFLIVIASLLFTDFLDGKLARGWDCSTIGGSLLDMSADKILGISILVILSRIYPIISISLFLELGIIVANTIGVINGNNGKSSEIGRIKTVIMGLSICSLFFAGLSNELVSSLGSINVNTLINFVNNNKSAIESVSLSSLLVSEGIVLTDYSLKAGKKNIKKDITKEELIEKKNKLLSLLKEKEYFNNILFNVEYNKIVKDKVLMEKLIPNDNLIGDISKIDKDLSDNVKKLVLKN